MEHYVGQRLSLKGQPCTVQYVGVVADKPGEWLGVEWDDPERGKHDGTHDGKKYFDCRNPSPRAASFLKPTQSWDKPRTFLQALREKYMPEDAGTGAEIVYFSTKQAEEVGFEKFARRQAQLQGIHVLVLDHMQIRGDQSEDESKAITETCANVSELDLSRNLFESLDEILSLARLLPKLSRLTLGGNRFSVNAGARVLQTIRILDLSDTWLRWDEIAVAAERFPNVFNLTAANNGLEALTIESLPAGIQNLDLADNAFRSLSDLEALKSCPNLQTLALKRNRVEAVSGSSSRSMPFSDTIQTLDLAQNAVSSWSFFDFLIDAYPQLNHLIISGNPLFQSLRSAEGKELTAQDGYMLTIARLPQVEMLNYSRITEKERLNSETYYLGQIAAELADSPAEAGAEILRKHPRWKALCEEYGEPSIRRIPKANELDPSSLAARLLAVTFVLHPKTVPASTLRTWGVEIPKTLNIYSVLGIVGKRLGIMPLKLRLIWETGERDPISQSEGYTGPEWWDSSDESDDEPTNNSDLVLRDVELVPGTRAIGTYIEGHEARVRVEIRG